MGGKREGLAELLLSQSSEIALTLTPTNQAQTNLPHTYANILPICCQYIVNMLPIYCQYVANILPISYSYANIANILRKYHNILPSSWLQLIKHKPISHTHMPINYLYFANILPKYCQYITNILSICYQHITKYCKHITLTPTNQAQPISHIYMPIWIPICCQYITNISLIYWQCFSNILPTYWQHIALTPTYQAQTYLPHTYANILPIFCQYITNILPIYCHYIYYQFIANRLPIYFQYNANISPWLQLIKHKPISHTHMPIYYQYVANILPAYYQYIAKISPWLQLIKHKPISQFLHFPSHLLRTVQPKT